MDDIFCKIVNKEVEADIIKEDDNWIAISDIRPKAPTHILIIPKKHISGFSAIEDEDVKLVGELMVAVKNIAKDLGLDSSGYKVVVNQGKWGGQEVDHLHIHLLGGKSSLK